MAKVDHREETIIASEGVNSKVEITLRDGEFFRAVVMSDIKMNHQTIFNSGHWEELMDFREGLSDAVDQAREEMEAE